ncbi:hypothetical protein DHEL01_v210570 [Diaporthe helianthi]|uniref:Uncharacterized protein n=1 Tax=Diaporthe helianthi TaxID=158607 RepID=A0A2P5HLB7_DIAHE|nr:hypothetical protein DHEL01_v210570 [Diaporthe helianthi]
MVALGAVNPQRHRANEQADSSLSSDASMSFPSASPSRSKSRHSHVSLEILEPTQPVADHVKLEQLVKEWMRARGIARQCAATNNKAVFHLFENANIPQQEPSETLDAYLSRLQHELRELHRSKEAKNHSMSFVCEQSGERVGAQSKKLNQQSKQVKEYETLLETRRERLDEFMKDQDDIRNRQDKVMRRQAEVMANVRQVLDSYC